jgi:hypothetical protein
VLDAVVQGLVICGAVELPGGGLVVVDEYLGDDLLDSLVLEYLAVFSLRREPEPGFQGDLERRVPALHLAALGAHDEAVPQAVLACLVGHHLQRGTGADELVQVDFSRAAEQVQRPRELDRVLEHLPEMLEARHAEDEESPLLDLDGQDRVGRVQ